MSNFTNSVSEYQFANTYRKRKPLPQNKLAAVPKDLQLPARDNPLHDGLAVFANVVLERTSAIDYYREGEFIPMRAEYLRSILSGRYSNVINEAERIGLIERHHCYQNEHFPKAVRLTERYRDGAFRMVLLKHARHAKKTINHDPFHQWLADSLSRFTISDKFTPADEWSRYTAEAIRQKRWSFFRDEFGNRLHTNFSRAPLSIRGAVLMQHNSISSTIHADSDLVCLDVRNCQPLVIGWLAGQWWLSKGHPIPSDVLEWQDRCQAGKLYEDLAEKANRERSGNQYDREWVKQNLMTAHYAEQRIVDTCYLSKVERRYYKSIYEYLCHLRCQPIEGEPKGLWFRHTAMLAQRTESQIIIDTACKLLMATCPEASVLTIHDALIVARSYLSAATAAIMEAFGHMGLRPDVKVERLADIKPRPPLSAKARAARNRRIAKKKKRYAAIRGVILPPD